MLSNTAEDETLIALRNACDRHAGLGKTVDGFPAGLVQEIADCLPPNVFQVTVLPDGTVALRIDPEFDRYVTFATKYWTGLVACRA